MNVPVFWLANNHPPHTGLASKSIATFERASFHLLEHYIFEYLSDKIRAIILLCHICSHINALQCVSLLDSCSEMIRETGKTSMKTRHKELHEFSDYSEQLNDSLFNETKRQCYRVKMTNL